VRRGAAPWRWVAAAALLTAWGQARAQGLTLTLEPGYSRTSEEVRDQLGQTTRRASSTFVQSYRLNFDGPVGPALQATVGGLVQDRVSWQEVSAHRAEVETTERGAWARLLLSLPSLSGGLTYDVGDRRTSGALRLVREDLAGYLGWRPADLPEITLRLTRSHHYDAARALQDQTTVGAILSARYRVDAAEARYVAMATQPSDAVTGTATRSIDQVAQGSYSRRLFEDRTAAYAALTLRNHVTTTLAPGLGTLSVQQHPVGGLSLIEVFPALPEEDVLVPNPALVDGNLVTGAALELGYAASVAGDRRPRDLGAQLGDLLTSVNRLQVWVDRQLPPEVAAAYGWTAWRSDDNQRWAPVAITGPVTFNAFQSEFEIPIAETRARYLKVVTQPLAAGVTTDPAYASVQVTELQLLLVTPASATRRETASSGALVTASATTRVWRAANLSWDVAATLERRLSPDATIWSLLNGLAATQDLTRALQVSERLARQDGDYGLGRQGQTDWSAGLLWRPLPTFSGSLVYSGQYVDARPVLDLDSGRYLTEPGNLTNTLASLARADLYQGVSAQLQASAGMVYEPDGTSTLTEVVNATTSLTPNAWMTFKLGWFSTLSTVFTAGASAEHASARVDAGVDLRPTEAISLTGTLSRRLAGQSRATSGTGQLNYAPLRGDLYLSLTLSDTFDTASQVETVLFSPGLRWNVRPGFQVNASYTLLDTSAPASRTLVRTAGIGASILL